MHRRITFLILEFVVFLSLISCATELDSIDDLGSPELFFKNAQKAMDMKRYNDAFFYYDVFLVRYPELHEKTIAAEYERAFIHYKRGRTKIAEAEFQAIIFKYENHPYAILYPPRFKQLCEIALNNIKRNKKVNNRLFWRLRENQWAEENGESLTDVQE